MDQAPYLLLALAALAFIGILVLGFLAHSWDREDRHRLLTTKDKPTEPTWLTLVRVQLRQRSNWAFALGTVTMLFGFILLCIMAIVLLKETGENGEFIVGSVVAALGTALSGYIAASLLRLSESADKQLENILRQSEALFLLGEMERVAQTDEQKQILLAALQKRIESR